MSVRNRSLVAVGGVALLLSMAYACGGSEPAPDKPAAAQKGAKAKGRKAQAKDDDKDAGAKGPSTPLPTLMVVQAQFTSEGGRPKPLPAKLVLLRKGDGEWFRESFTDGDANVFHKAIAWNDGILTIGAERAPKPAHLKLWKRGGDGWTSETIWEQAWDGAKFNRLRDVEIGDVNHDGSDEIVIATHDKGVVAVGSKSADGWSFVEMDERPDTFVHEIEIGDVDGDGKLEFYATPSARNRASGESQPGSVWRYDFDGTTYKGAPVVDYEESHAKEITVADMDGDGTDELYVVREAHTVKEDGTTRRVDPVRIVRFTYANGAWTDSVYATLDDDQCRFLVPGDVDGDGKLEMVAAGFKSGLWMLDPQDDGTVASVQIDKNSGGFEHATHIADLDGDGKVEIYVAADEQKQFRAYTYNGTGFDREVLGPIGPAKNSHITWNIQDGSF